MRLKSEEKQFLKMSKEEARARLRAENPGMWDEDGNLTEQWGGMDTDYR